MTIEILLRCKYNEEYLQATVWVLKCKQKMFLIGRISLLFNWLAAENGRWGEDYFNCSHHRLKS